MATRVRPLMPAAQLQRCAGPPRGDGGDGGRVRVGRNRVEWEPADLAALVRFSVDRLAVTAGIERGGEDQTDPTVLSAVVMHDSSEVRLVAVEPNADLLGRFSANAGDGVLASLEFSAR